MSKSIKMHLYEFRTAKFGIILHENTSIKEARTWAKKAFPDQYNKHSVTRRQPYHYCEHCDSKPCCCKE